VRALVSSTDSDFVVALALRAAELTALGAALMLGTALVIRRWMHWQQAVRQRIAAQWRPVLTQIALDEGPLPPLPAVKPRHSAHVLHEWTAIQDCLRGAGTERLNEMARVAGLDRLARVLTRHGDVSASILAMRTAGHLRDATFWPLLRERLDSRNAVVSFYAAAAMIRIDTQRAMPDVMLQLAARESWPSEAVARLLKDAGTDIAREPVRTLIMSLEPARVPRLLPWLGRVDPVLASDVAAELLRRGTGHPRTVSAALLILQDAALLPVVRSLVTSEDFVVRKNVATCLGRIGEADDAALIVELMGDRVWWVRYRAAQALTNLSGMNAAWLERLRAGLRDRFARDMLDHVLAEGARP